jgi:PAS domain S-box-containing protein
VANLIERLRPFLAALVMLLLGAAWLVARQKMAREAAERDIRISEIRFRTLLESAPDAVIVTDFTGQIVLVNARAEELFDYERGELIGQNVDCLVPERFRAHHADHRAGYAAAPTTREMAASSDLVGRRRDGTEVPVGISLSPVEIEGETFIFSDVRDKTEKREAERQIMALNARLSRDNAALNAVNNELEAFSYSMSHDLRAPLRAIDGFSQALLEDFGDDLPEAGKDYLYRVRRATQRMGTLIDDLLALARVTRSDVHLETVDLSAMATDIVASLRERDPARTVAVDIEPGVTMQADARLMRLALENLFDNAWKFTSKEDMPRIGFGRMASDGADVCVIRDNGAGFDMAYADKLFGAFQRLHDQGQFPGSGIGLATVQRIVTKHGGTIWAESEPGKGATFCFKV